ncbi:MAG: M15 family metallopeptidase [Pseudomonadota bacterium]|nr:M15 family metallopeptidase [Pseudomonadota bacterium]
MPCVLALAGCASSFPAGPAISPARTPQQAGLTDIQTLVPDMALDIRYASADNFVGTTVDGYEAPKCYLLTPAAEALARVEHELRSQNLRLKIFDCYRPRRAVLHFVRWSEDLQDQRTKPAYYPNLDKRKLMGEYISSTSGHSRGATLDLTLLQCDARNALCEPLDMGTQFDFFDVRANTDSSLATPQQRANRNRLLAAMARHGFSNYPLEWWHYTLKPEPSPAVSFDVPVR